jgi:hypothetical protein
MSFYGLAVIELATLIPVPLTLPATSTEVFQSEGPQILCWIMTARADGRVYLVPAAQVTATALHGQLSVVSESILARLSDSAFGPNIESIGIDVT